MNKHQKQIIENYVSSYNNFDVNGMTADLSDGVVFENVSNGTVGLRTEGLEAFTQQAESAKQYFKVRKQTIESWTFDKSTVIIDISYKAILAIDLPNGMQAGDALELKGKSVFEFDVSNIKKITDYS